ncbi:uncharacterized protein LOC126820938 [Patella vulgata]|uniref:uncharacterized protein LOC126820938 n=1 Tax=Patella vulgata TaxID=6465 RepID=UPI0024A7C622|nr:uncharacterized protein LOC126820938 [Patella vulgata]XP_050405113.2 uncharacterized protein LOC126820938 [Patella vulgata]
MLSWNTRFRLVKVVTGMVVGLLLIVSFLLSSLFRPQYWKHLPQRNWYEDYFFEKWYTHCQNDDNNVVEACSSEFADLKDVLVLPILNTDDALPTFRLNCKSPPSVVFQGANHLNDWYKNIECVDKDMRQKSFVFTEKRLTIMVRRDAYTNIYHTMADFYNAFLVMKILKGTPNTTHILLWDQHPKWGPYNIWSTLFEKVIRTAEINSENIYSHLAWSILGSNSPLNAFLLPTVPYLDEFRDIFLSRFELSPAAKLNCQHLNILFVWRHDSVAYPWYPVEHMRGKLLNELEVLASVRQFMPGHEVKGVQLDSLSYKAQLQLIASTDILIGIHGSGLTNAIFLPGHSGLIEMFPDSSIEYPSARDHFKYIAGWRKLKYLRGDYRKNNYRFPNYNIHIDPHNMNKLINQMKAKIC